MTSPLGPPGRRGERCHGPAREAVGPGLGIGARVVDEGVRVARQTGYRRITPPNISVLVPVRYIYEQAGFRIVRRERHRSFGHEHAEEIWTPDL